MGSQLARFIQHQQWYKDIESLFAGSNLIAFSVFLALGFGIFVLLTRFGSKLFGLTEDEVLGRFSPMVPVLVPLAFTGEIVYRLEYFLSHIGDFLPTFGRQFGLAMNHLHFSISSSVIDLICILLLCIGAFACSYILYLFNRDDFEGILKKKNYIFLNILIFGVFLSYIILFSV